MKPLVSAVIPTYNRPQLVTRAVKSALRQTLKEIEVIVVIDGPDKTTREVLASINDSRLKVIELPIKVRGAAARNAGVAESQGEWVALLDDDDEWLPEKLARQLKVAQQSQFLYPIIACLHIRRTPQGDYIWPRRLPAPSEHLSEYLLARKGLFRGETAICTPTLFFNKSLMQRMSMKEERRIHQDWDWLLRVSALEGVGIEFVPEPLSIIWEHGLQETTGTIVNWRSSLDWIQPLKETGLVTPCAYAAFLMTTLGAAAAKAGDWRAFWLLLSKAVKQGKPKPIYFPLYFGMWLFPPKMRRWLRAIFTRQRH
ncbi:glycosyl transferase [Candidatus Thiomargarita nelsonii]|uniref:Glycosyl transferase n=1 Tax=Candidatus Thiomargarita nelsonii TaxID=1003181 RepID=A0A0A6P689_9GAMM|nr:glycosyl transferase [Candidatus Thiomargarita nelsonii]